jgi:hypothetical protein
LGQILEFLGHKGMGASSQLKELLPLQAQMDIISLNPGALNKGKNLQKIRK